MFKIVDNFNGWEDTKRYESEDEASLELDKAKDEFRANNVGSICCLVVTPADAKWIYNHDNGDSMWKL
jgi:hypothetical protein